MFALLNKILAEVEKISTSQIIAPRGKMKPGDVSIAILKDNNLQKLWTLRMQFQDKLISLQDEALHLAIDERTARMRQGKNHDPATCKGCIKACELEEITAEYTFINQLFWVEVKALLTDKQKAELDKASGTIALYADWELIVTPHESPFGNGNIECPLIEFLTC